LYAVCGAQESDEFLRQNQLIQTVWGAARVPVCEALTGENHFSMLETLVRADGRTHALAKQCLRNSSL
jgi:arylformamidase